MGPGKKFVWVWKEIYTGPGRHLNCPAAGLRVQGGNAWISALTRIVQIFIIET
jgi:hypothetical protein